MDAQIETRTLPELDEAARQRWQQAVSQLIARGGFSRQADLAAAMASELGLAGDARRVASFQTALTRFKRGDRGELRRWFLRLGEFPLLTPFSRSLSLTEEELWELLEQAATGLSRSNPRLWHPAFPNIGPGQVALPAVLQGLARVPVPLLARLLVEEWCQLQAGESGDSGWSSRRGSPQEGQTFDARLTWIWLIGPAGSGRKTAARQLWEALREPLLARMRVEPWLVLEVPLEGWASAWTRHPGPTVAVASTVPPVAEGAHHVYRVATWDVAEVAELCAMLARGEPLPTSSRAELHRFAERLDPEPELLGPDCRPDALLDLLARVSRGQPPATPQETRQQRLDLAWERAVARAPLLATVRPDLMTAFWSRWLFQTGEMPFTRIGRTAAWQVLDAVSEGLPGEVERRNRQLELVKQLEAGPRGPVGVQSQALAELRRLLEVPAADALLGALVRGGLLEERAGGELLEATDATAALLWAAVGLVGSDLKPLEGQWERMLDPHWIPLVREMALAGMKLAPLLALIDAAPLWLSGDTGTWLVTFAACSEEEVPLERLIPAWAGTLWSVLHQYFVPNSPIPGEPLLRLQELEPLLVRLSRRYADRLPHLQAPDPIEAMKARGFLLPEQTFEACCGPDYVAALEALVPAELRVRVKRWRATPELLEGATGGLATWDCLQTGHPAWRSRALLRAELTRLAPFQAPPVPLEVLDRWDPLTRPRCWSALERAAARGFESARRVLAGLSLDGQAALEGDAEARWHARSLEHRLAWLGQTETLGPASWRALERLLSEQVGSVQGEADPGEQTHSHLAHASSLADWLGGDSLRDQVLEVFARFWERDPAQVTHWLRVVLSPLSRDAARAVFGERVRGPLFSPRLASGVAVRLKAFPVLESLCELPTRWSARVQLRVVEDGLFLLYPALEDDPFSSPLEDCRRLASFLGEPSEGTAAGTVLSVGEGGWRASLCRMIAEAPLFLPDSRLDERLEVLSGLEEIMSRLSARAELAAEVLYRCGRPGPLRRLWQDGVDWRFTERFLETACRFQALRFAGRASLADIARAPLPEDACRRWLEHIGPIPAWLRRIEAGTPWRQTLRSLGQSAPATLLLAVESLGRMVWVVPPLEWPEALVSFLHELHPARRRRRQEHAQWSLRIPPGMQPSLALPDVPEMQSDGLGRDVLLPAPAPPAAAPPLILGPPDAHCSELHLRLTAALEPGDDRLLLILAHLSTPSSEVERARAGVVSPGARVSGRARALEHLIDAGDDALLEGWLNRLEALSADMAETSPLRELDDALLRSPLFLDRAWDAARTRTRARARLLERVMQRHPLAPGGAAGALPRWYFEAVRLSPLAVQLEMLEKCWDRPEALPGILELLLMLPPGRTRARWAFRLHRHRPWSPPVMEALSDWLFEPDPFAGGLEWVSCSPRPPSQTGAGDGAKSEMEWSGGVRSLLEVLSSAPVGPIGRELVPGLKSLWKKSLILPFSPLDLTGFPVTEASADPARPVTLVYGDRQRPILPSPVRELARVLERLGELAPLLETFQQPPSSQPGDALRLPGSETRERLFRFWLLPWWCRQCSREGLHALLGGEERVVRYVVDFMIEVRRDPALVEPLVQRIEAQLMQGELLEGRGLGEHLPVELPLGSLTALMRIAPERVPLLVRTLRRRYPEKRRELAALLGWLEAQTEVSSPTEAADAAATGLAGAAAVHRASLRRLLRELVTGLAQG